jgi:hypothetical protein
VFENGVLRKTFAPKREEVTGDWRKLRIEEVHDRYCSQNIISVVMSRNMIWAGHVECVGKKRNEYSIWYGSLKERDHLEDVGVDGWILKEILKKCNGRSWTGFSGLRIRTSGVLFRLLTTEFGSCLADASPCLMGSLSPFGPTTLCALCF